MAQMGALKSTTSPGWRHVSLLHGWPWVQHCKHLRHQRELALIRPSVQAEEGCVCVVLFWQHFACQWQTSCTKVKRVWTGSVLLKHFRLQNCAPSPTCHITFNSTRVDAGEKSFIFQKQCILNDIFRWYVMLQLITVVIVLPWHTRVLKLTPNTELFSMSNQWS